MTRPLRKFFWFLFLIAVALLIKRFYPLYWVPTGSMQPTIMGQLVDPATRHILREGDRLIVDRFGYSFANLNRGDIIVFTYPDPDTSREPRDYVQRLIGMPGDRILIASGQLFINGSAVSEPYVSEPAMMDFETVVPVNSVLTLGDNRNNAADGRFWGPLPIANIKGIPFYRYYPTARIGRIERYKISIP